MKTPSHLASAIAVSLLPFLSPLAMAGDLLGNWLCEGADGAHPLEFRQNATLLFDGKEAGYALMPGMILVQDDEGVAAYTYQLEGKELLIQYPDGALLRCQRSKSAQAAGKPPSRPQAGQVDNATLKREIAGTWWGYSGSTERKIGLCPDGRYRDFTESGYSGRSYDSGGTQTMGWGVASQGGNQGRWQIEGTYQSGTIRVETDSGRQFTLSYRQVGEPGCLDINGKRLCRTSKQCE
jgi:hypothetical protein